MRSGSFARSAHSAITLTAPLSPFSFPCHLNRLNLARRCTRSNASRFIPHPPVARPVSRMRGILFASLRRRHLACGDLDLSSFTEIEEIGARKVSESQISWKWVQKHRASGKRRCDLRCERIYFSRPNSSFVGDELSFPINRNENILGDRVTKRVECFVQLKFKCDKLLWPFRWITIQSE